MHTYACPHHRDNPIFWCRDGLNNLAEEIQDVAHDLPSGHLLRHRNKRLERAAGGAAAGYGTHVCKRARLGVRAIHHAEALHTRLDEALHLPGDVSAGVTRKSRSRLDTIGKTEFLPGASVQRPKAISPTSGLPP